MTELEVLIASQDIDRHRVRVGTQWVLSLDAFQYTFDGRRFEPSCETTNEWYDPVAREVIGEDVVSLSVDMTERRWRWASPRPPQLKDFRARKICPMGHPYDDFNTYWFQSPRNPQKMWRQCKTCRAARNATTKARERSKEYKAQRRRAV